MQMQRLVKIDCISFRCFSNPCLDHVTSMGWINFNITPTGHAYNLTVIVCTAVSRI